jgi:putative ABC transport system ATP-binding protein
MSILSVSNLSKTYGENETKVDALSNINLQIQKCEFIELVDK